MENFYKVLNVLQTASEEEITKTIEQELRLWDNRTNAPNSERQEEAENRLKLLEEIKSTLLDQKKRVEYDEQLRRISSEQVMHVEFKPEENLLEQANALLRENRIEEAKYVAKKATETDGSNHETWALLAWIKGELREFEDATYELKRAIEACPDNPDYYWMLASVYDARGMWKDAANHFDKVAQLQRDNLRIQLVVARMLTKLGDYHRAVSILETCIAKEPHNRVFSYDLAIAYHDLALSDWQEGPMRDFWGIILKGKPKTGLFCVSRESAKQSVMYLKKAIALDFEGQKFRKEIQDDLKIAKWCKRWHRKFTRRHTIKTAIFAIPTGIAFTLLYGIGLLILAGWFLYAFEPGWKINRKYLNLPLSLELFWYKILNVLSRKI